MIRKMTRNQEGFTLPEMLIATFILVIVFSGALVTFIRSMSLNQQSRDATAVLNAVKDRLTTMENYTYAQIPADFNEQSFTIPGITGIGVTYVDSSNPELYIITASFTWRQNDGRVMGDDINMNGTIEGAEDADGNGMLDSPVMLSSAVTNI